VNERGCDRLNPIAAKRRNNELKALRAPKDSRPPTAQKLHEKGIYKRKDAPA